MCEKQFIVAETKKSMFFLSQKDGSKLRTDNKTVNVNIKL